MGELAQQFGGAYFSTEGALWRTLKLLLTRPGELTVRYLAGQRKHFVLPLRLTLSISEATHELGPGDSFAFPSHLPHAYRNAGTEVARVLWINTPPTF